MTEKEIKEKWQKLYEDFVASKNKYTKFAQTQNTIKLTEVGLFSINKGVKISEE